MEREVTAGSSQPLHYQLQEIFAEKIGSGEWGVGQQIDSEPKLCARYGVSRATIRQAVLALVNRGLLVRKQGVGTFVATRRRDFDAVAARLPNDPEARHDLLGIDTACSDPEVADLLHLPPETLLTRVDRLRYLDNQPLSIEVSFVASSLCPGMDATDLSIPFIDILRDRYSINVVRRTATIEPVLLDLAQQATLDYSVDAPLGLLVTRCGYVSHGDVITVNKTTFRGDRYRVAIQ